MDIPLPTAQSHQHCWDDGRAHACTVSHLRASTKLKPTAARLPEALAEAEQRLASLRAIAGVRPETALKKKERKTRAVKTYRNPETGETYSKGKHPQWLKDALDAGRSKDEFLVHSSGV